MIKTNNPVKKLSNSVSSLLKLLKLKKKFTAQNFQAQNNFSHLAYGTQRRIPISVTGFPVGKKVVLNKQKNKYIDKKLGRLSKNRT